MLLWLLVSLVLLSSVAWGFLHWFIVPRIDDLRPRLERLASRAMGARVTAERIEAVSNGLIPVITLHGVTVRPNAPDGENSADGADGEAGLKVPRVLAAFSVRSLWRLGFEQLVIDGAQVQLRRRADGRLLVAGLDASGDASADTRLADWFFSQPELLLQGGQVRWVDETRAAPPVTLTDVSLLFRNGRRSHVMQLQATPQKEWGERFTLVGYFRQPLLSLHAGQWRQWSGQAYADFPRVDVAQLRRYAHAGDLGVELREGRGALRAWASVREGRQAEATLDVSLASVSAVLAPRLPPLALRSLAGRAHWQWAGSGISLCTENLQFEDASGAVWPGGNFSLKLEKTGGQLRADKLDLAALARLAAALPLGEAAHQHLRARTIQGQVDSLNAAWRNAPPAEAATADAPAIADWSLKLRASALAIGADAASGTPGLDGATLDVDASAQGGTAEVLIARGGLTFPGVFEEPRIALGQLKTKAHWQVQGRRISVQADSIDVDSADATGRFAVRWHTGDEAAGQPRFPGVLDLKGRFARANGARVHRYLPLVIPPEARHYVRDAVREGLAQDVDVAIQGDLRHVPFDEPGQHGQFRFAGRVKNVLMAYVPRSLQPEGQPAWPPLKNLAGQLIFEGNGMRVENASADVQGHPGWRFDQIAARIDDMARAVVQVKAQGQGDLAAALGIVRASPVAGFTQHALDEAEADGKARLALSLNLPIEHIEKSKASGEVTLAGNTIRFSPNAPPLAQAQGRVSFSEQGFALHDTHAQALGGPVRISGGSVAAGKAASATAGATAGNAADAPPAHSVRISASGTASAEGLRLMKNWSGVPGLATRASGSASYEVALDFADGEPDVTVTSDLRGLSFKLPAPLDKPAADAWPLLYERRALPGGLQRLTIRAGKRFRAEYEQQSASQGGRVLRGALALGETSVHAASAAALPASGVTAHAALDALPAAEWQDALDAIFPGASDAQTAPASSTSSSYMPDRAHLHARQLLIGRRTLHAVQADAARQGSRWSAKVHADELAGQIEYRPAQGQDAGLLRARLERLHWPEPDAAPPEEAATASAEKPEEAEKTEETASGEAPAQTLSRIPALDISVQDMRLHGKNLGQLDIRAVHHASGNAAEGQWQLNTLRLQNPDATLSAHGSWAAPAKGGARRTRLDFTLEAANAGHLLARLGMPDTLRGGKGQITGQLHWSGSPAAPHYPSLGGHLRLDMGEGQFLKADPGAAKLLGVLSLQALPRRLTLDFRDLFSAGFAFDQASADVSVAAGVARTTNLRISSANATVLMQGSADIARETQDLTALVMPEIDAGNAALATAFVNPAAGAIAFIAQLALRKPLSRAAMREFRITGSWSDPVVQQIERKEERKDETPAEPQATSGG